MKTDSATRLSQRWGFWIGALCALGLAPYAAGAGTRKEESVCLPLKVVGNHLEDSDGKRVILRGVNCAGLEWSSTGDSHILKTIDTAIHDWHARIIRLPLSQDRWFGTAPEQTDKGAGYRALVRQVVDTCASNGVYILLDLHWSDGGEWGGRIGQWMMPDDNSLTFWRSFAAVYRNNPAVLFDLYNEPHDVSWDVWQHGGTITERNQRQRVAKTYHAVGMQTVLDTIRSTGAQNVVVAGGLNWAYDMEPFLAGRQLSDPLGNGVVYANHNYPIKGETVAQWLAHMEKVEGKLCVIVSEFGSESRPGAAATTKPTWLQQVLAIIHKHGWNYTAWDLHPSAGPRLVSDWNYTPTPSFGALVKADLLTKPGS